jgi:hypothetical protein
MKSIIQLVMLFCIANAYAQDIILLRNCDMFPAKVTEINISRIKYKADTGSSKELSIPVSEVSTIKCYDGTATAFTQVDWDTAQAIVATGLDTLNSSYLYQKGIKDARICYDGYHNAATAAFFLSGSLWYIGACASEGIARTPPQMENLNHPSTTLINNPDYYNGYMHQAMHRKYNKVGWNSLAGFFTGFAIFLVIVSTK